MSSHFFHRRMGRRLAVETLRLETIDRLLRPQPLGQVVVEEDRTRPRVHEEEWRARAARLDRNQ